jgi:hypothetical protein
MTTAATLASVIDSTTGKLNTSIVNAGGILQVVSGFTNTEISTTAVDTWVSSGLTASITPRSTSSRILIIASQNIGIDGTTTAQDQQFNLGIFRDSTLIFGILGFDDSRFNPVVDAAYRAGISFLDSPATTSTITYSTRGSLRLPSTTSTVRMQYSSVPSSMVLLEIAG